MKLFGLEFSEWKIQNRSYNEYNKAIYYRSVINQPYIDIFFYLIENSFILSFSRDLDFIKKFFKRKYSTIQYTVESLQQEIDEKLIRLDKLKCIL